VSDTRQRIKKYRDKHPGATVREIQKACDVSSPSVVHFHLKKLERKPCECCGKTIEAERERAARIVMRHYMDWSPRKQADAILGK